MKILEKVNLVVTECLLEVVEVAKDTKEHFEVKDIISVFLVVVVTWVMQLSNLTKVYT